MNLKIKEIPINERPRERLINCGVESLSNEELLSLLLESGIKDISVKAVSLNLLKYVENIQNLKNITYQELVNIKGIGKAKACIILSAIELSRRMNTNYINNLKLIKPDIVVDYFKNIIGDKKQECFYCVYLDNSKKIIENKLIFMGTINESIVHPREIFKTAYKLSATSIICVHNHPSGNINPSKNDILVTENLIKIGVLLGISIVDHIIISNNNYYSFKENGQI